jgi:hypothetical protein
MNKTAPRTDASRSRLMADTIGLWGSRTGLSARLETGVIEWVDLEQQAQKRAVIARFVATPLEPRQVA